MNHTSESLASALQRAGYSLFNDRRSDATARARDCLEGRTHYVDADTMRYFRARVLSCSVLESGLLLGIVESFSADWNHSARIFRPVFFDIFGTVVSRPSIENAFKGRAAATREFWRVANGFDTLAHYSAVLAGKAEKMQRDAAELRALLEGAE